MPITVDQRVQVFDQAEFGAVAYEVVEQALAIHNEFGRFFGEDVYQTELIRCLGPRASKEVWIYVTHGDFQKPYRADVLVDQGAPFELKAVDKLGDVQSDDQLPATDRSASRQAPQFSTFSRRARARQ